MNIGIDGRLWRETGVGRYIRALVHELGEIDEENNYVLWLKKKEFEDVELPNSRWQKVIADVPWHSINEQLYMPGIYKQACVDLIHIPYFSVPLLTPKPFIVTIHDLTISDFATGKATTKPMPVYALKRIGYNLVLGNAINKAERIITVSETVKKQIIERYKVKPEKVVVTYESGELEKISNIKYQISNIQKEILHYILYVGNAHPHKNLERLIKAFHIIRQKLPEMRLVLVGKDDYFYKNLKDWVNQGNMGDRIEFFNEVDNAKLVKFYRQAELFIFPSLSEGFGIPGLEAMSLGCPVIVSDIPVFREIYGQSAKYFNPRDEKEMAYKLFKRLELLKDKTIKEQIVEKGKIQAGKYSWRIMAKQTLSIYEDCISL